MKLFIKPGACSLAPHIVLHELGIAHDTEKVDTKTGKTASGADYLAINPKGYVPALQLDDGVVLTEGAAIVQYLADQHPESGLAPANGTVERAQLQAWLNFTGSELHKNFSPFFNPAASDDWKTSCRQSLERRLDYLNQHLDGRDYLLGKQFSVADPYLYVVLGWSKFIKLELAPWANVVAFTERMAARPAVQAARQAEGLK